MPVLNPVRTIETTEDATALTALMAEPETVISDAPVPCPQAAGGVALLLGLGLLLSPPAPKEPRK